ncbi:MAG: hypothetical protein IJA77_01330 [Clostridia bacterium]|nr:hypothetical protein [Clostridia bacterium]
MNLDRCLLFSWLEEDNIQKAYFRVRPLLTVEGDVRQESEQLWPNEGCLRIVPDRNEQHTFKVRMRTLGSYCVVDLRNQPAEAGKIRTNKNFRPDKGEVNQYILYSDTVHPLPENVFYHIVEGTAEEYAAACEKAITPCFYIREGDTLYGPVRREVPGKPEPAQEAAGTLFELPCPDGVTRLILCMNDEPAAEAPAPVAEAVQAQPAPQIAPEAQEPAPAVQATEAPAAAPEAPAEDAALPIGQSLQILDHTKDFEETLQTLDKPVSKDANLLRQPTPKPAAPLAPSPVKPGELNGTPLIRTPLKTSTPQPKNRVQEVVASQLTIGKYEPPTQNLPAGTAMRDVANPVEAACASFRQAWNASDAHGQLLDCILSLDGVRSKLEPRLCSGSGETIMQHVLQSRLQDLEAERLTALCELDRAHRDVEAYKDELLSGMKGRVQRETSQLEADKTACAQRVEALKNEINALSDQRDALIARVDELQNAAGPAAIAKLLTDAQMVAPAAGTPLRMSPAAGTAVAADALIERLMNACADSGVAVGRNQAIAILVLLALCPRFGLVTPTPAPVATLVRNIVSAFGWSSSYAHQIAPEQKPVVALRPVDSTPAVLMTSLPNYAPIPGVSKVMLSRIAANLTRNVAYDASQWPVLMLPALPFVEEKPTKEVAPVSAASLTTLLEKRCAENEEITAVLGPVLKAASPLSGAARREMFQFISVCAGLMEGGLPVAVDWAILLWILPAIDRSSRNYQAVKALLDEYPLSLAAM